jgi:hypothetical protein
MFIYEDTGCFRSFILKEMILKYIFTKCHAKILQFRMV